jgi:DHA1 family tetracycline resistance protein-like MFS transporter
LLSSTLTKAVHPQEVGGILGFSASIESSTRILAPILGGYLLGSWGSWAPGVFGAVILAVLSYYVWRAIYGHPIAAEIRARSNTSVPAPSAD